MEFKALGKSNLRVSVIGFGGIPIQRVNLIEVKELLLKAQEKGINFIDSARGYSVSEEYIGEALVGKRENWILASKSMARDKTSMERDLKISLKNFRTGYIDLYQLHNIKTEEELKLVLSENGAYSALLEAKEKGEIGHIGITSHSIDLLKIAIETGYFETIMYPYNIVENQAEELFSRAHQLNIGVIAMKPMAGGAIIDGKLALKYILKNPSVTMAIPGMATLEEVEENTSIVGDNSSLSQEEIERINKISEELTGNFCRRCGYCGPCKQKIDIPSMFLMSGYKNRYNLGTWAEERYFAQALRAKDCVECGVCEEKCPYGLPIMDMLKEVRVTFKE
ncbi:MAG: aldo/keto reductase [Clostridiaceae bacterium]|nr:aldo/keto reductase [Clostridiaceae bacterium]